MTTPPTPLRLATSIYELLMSSQDWPTSKLNEAQTKQLEMLVRHARDTVPYFRACLDHLFDGRGGFRIERWPDTPILRRQDIAAHSLYLRSVSVPSEHGNLTTESTSGSTGTPISVTTSKLHAVVSLASDWRAQQRWGFDWSRNMVHWHGMSDTIEKRGIDFNLGPWGCPSHMQSPAGAIFVANDDLSTDALTDHLTRHGARYLGAQADRPFVAALNLAKMNRQFPLDGIWAWGLNVEPEHRVAIQQTFGCDVFDMYSSKEGGRMGHSCARCGAFHVNAESVLLEILDEHGQPCELGQTGRVIVTTLYNWAQPFIRYEQGDQASWFDGPPCTDNLPRISRVAGRTYHQFVRPNGEFFAPLVPDSLRPQLGATYWQFVQTAENEITVRYKPDAVRDIGREVAFAALLQQQFKGYFKIGYDILEELPLTPARKFIKYVRAFKTNGAP